MEKGIDKNILDQIDMEFLDTNIESPLEPYEITTIKLEEIINE